MPGPLSYPEAYRNVLKVRVVRHFRDQALSDAHLHAILEAGRWTGSSKNRQAWSVVVITDPDRRERIADCGDFTDPVRRAPLTMALVQEAGGYEFDIGRLAQNLVLAANALGVGTCPVTFHRSDEAAVALDLTNGASCRYGVAFGYPLDRQEPARLGGRKPLEQFVHWETY
jgi:nitroreductase